MRHSPWTIDFETTGKDAAVAFPIEAALASPDDGAFTWERFIALPEGQTIPPETSAVHHIVDADLDGAPDWDTIRDSLWDMVTLGEGNDENAVIMIAHNAEYEQTILAGSPFDHVRWICTFRCALVAWPDAPSHSNEALRYWLGFGTGRSAKQASHSALHDCRVTAGIFRALYGWFYTELRGRGVLLPSVEILSEEAQDAVYAEMIRISKEMPQLPTCPIGKERGKKWADIDSGFLSWCLRQPDMREDVKHCARKELDRRASR